MDSIDILRDLIAFPTISRRSNADLISYVIAVLRHSGASVDCTPGPTAGTINLWATIGPGDRPGVILSGHSDVVPVEGQTWTSDPFELKQRDGLLYGRGTADMKGFVACALVAMLKAGACVNALRSPIHLALSCDEEIGCVGVRPMLAALAALPVRPALCIIGEPTSMRIATGHKGKLAARVVCTGKAAHSALPHEGLNAIHLAVELVGALRKEQASIERDGVRDATFEVPYSTIQTGTIEGGVAVNVVPSQCNMEFEIRTIPDDNVDNILRRIRAAAAKIVIPHVARFPGAAITLEQNERLSGSRYGKRDSDCVRCKLDGDQQPHQGRVRNGGRTL